MRLFFLPIKLRYQLQRFFNLFRSRKQDPHITYLKRYKLSVKQVKEQLGAGKSVKLPFGQAFVNVELKQVKLNTEPNSPNQSNAFIDQSDINIYQGSILGKEKTSDVRLCLFDDEMSVMIMDDNSMMFIEPAHRYIRESTPNEYIGYLPKDVFIKELCPNTPPRSTQPNPEPEADLPSQSKTYVVAMVADQEYQDSRTLADGRSRWVREQIELINIINGFFASLYNFTPLIQFEPRHFVLDAVRAPLTSSDSLTLLRQLESGWSTVHGDLKLRSERERQRIDLVHLTTGKNLEGLTIGRGFEPGVYSLSQQTYSSGPTFSGGGGFRAAGNEYGFTPNLFRRAIIVAHELAHNFNANHENGDEYCTFEFLWCWEGERTIMYPQLTNSTIGRFSTGERESSKNNFARIHLNHISGRDGDFT